MPRTLDILSVDLDWFNHITAQHYGSADTISDKLRRFCQNLKDSCSLPTKVAWMNEHQYLYPWVLRLLKSRQAKQVNVVNIDAHHDFYHVDGIEDFRKATISCADFFGFMVYDGILNHYEWINNNTVHSTRWAKDEVLDVVEANPNKQLQKWACGKSNFKVYGPSSIWDTLRGRTFDGVAFIESHDYTEQLPLVRRIVKEALRDEGFVVKEHKWRRDFRYSQRKKIDLRPIFRVATLAK